MLARGGGRGQIQPDCALPLRSLGAERNLERQKHRSRSSLPGETRLTMQDRPWGIDPAALEATLRREVLSLRSLKGEKESPTRVIVDVSRENSRSEVLSQALGSAYEQLVQLKAANREVATLRKRLAESEDERAEVGWEWKVGGGGRLNGWWSSTRRQWS